MLMLLIAMLLLASHWVQFILHEASLLLWFKRQSFTSLIDSVTTVFPRLRLQSPLSTSCRSPSLSEMPLGSMLGRRPTSHRNICTKVLLAEGRETPFTEHCRDYENSYRVRLQLQRCQYVTMQLGPRH